MSKILGIDLGTTNSCMAILVESQPVVIPNAEGERTTPSIVAFTQDGQRLVGASAKQQQVSNPRQTIFSIKRFMGRLWNEVSEEMAMVPYLVEKGDGGDVHITVWDRLYAPAEISAMILQKLKVDAEAYLGEPVTDAVITVPAYFNNAQRKATEDAGRIAGLNILRIINEPTAASLAYGLGQAQAQAHEQEQTVLVFDLGGGTFDVSILDLGFGLFEVKSTSGDNHLGGDNFDQAIVNWMLAEFKREQGIDLITDTVALPRLYQAAEQAKSTLSSSSVAHINLPLTVTSADGAKHLALDLTREKFNALSADLLARTLGPIKQALADAGITPTDIDHVVLVGGMTRMPAVVDGVSALIGKLPHQGLNPDEVVAVGAAIQAGILAGEVQDTLLLDVTPLSLGIETKGGIFTRLITRNTRIPTTKMRTFTTAEDNQTSVEIHVLQGESEMAAFNKTLGVFQLRNITPARRGLMEIDVSFDIDANGIIHVHAQDIATDYAQEMSITGGTGLSEVEVSRMVREAEKHATEACKLRELAEARNLAEVLAMEIEYSLTAHGDKVEAVATTKIETRILALREVLVGSDAVEIRVCIKALTEAAQVLTKTANKQLSK